MTAVGNAGRAGQPPFHKVLVANRGEIAVRVMRTLRRLGIRSVAVYSDADRDALHVRRADEAVALGDARAYLDVDAVVAAAVETGAQAVHPGYGFLSENPALARACAAAGVVFVGPPAEAMEAMGDKINAKRRVAAAGVPVVPGRDEAGLSDEQLAAAALDIGLPVLLKPSAGGGGKGMRLVHEPGGLPSAIAAARREAIGAFGDGTLLVERFVDNPRHIEVQVFADTHGAVFALGERECSLQRRHQKIIEEAPSPLLDDGQRAAMMGSSVAVARSCGYLGAGTVEYIVPGNGTGEYYFMEMNTRLQVEHPVTEEVLGLDLVELQLCVAAGGSLPWGSQSEVPHPHGHAVEARVYAEDARRGFLPCTGTVLHLAQPDQRPHVRVDSALHAGARVGTDYDPMLAKVVAWGPTRLESLRTLAEALAGTTVLGITTNVGFLRRLASHPAVLAGDLDTGLVERDAAALQPDEAPDHVVAAAALLERLLAAPPPGTQDPWQTADGWRLAGPSARHSLWHSDGRDVAVSVRGDWVSVGRAPAFEARADLAAPARQARQAPAQARQAPAQARQAPAQARQAPAQAGQVRVEANRRRVTYSYALDGDTVWLGRDGDAWHLERKRETIAGAGKPPGLGGPVTSPMPGTVLQLHAKTGDLVTAGQPLVSVEAMKMEHTVVATADGIVSEILVQAGESVALDQPLVVVEASAS